MKLVAALKMLPTPEQAACLTATLERCNAACSWLAGVGFAAETFRQYDLHKMAYIEIRSRFGLTAQAAVRSIAKVADAFKVNREVAPVFRPDAAQPYDDRIIRFVKDGSAVSLWTIEGRMVVPIVMGEHQRRLMAYRKGEVDLCIVRGKWTLAATCEIPETDEFKAEDWLGVDLGIVSLVVDSNGTSKVISMADIAYTAGLFDGEGCITMSHRLKSSRARLRIQISGAHTETLQWLKSVYGGAVSMRKPQTGKRGPGKAVNVWNQGTIKGCLEFLTMIRPFLREKAEQADVALVYLQHRASGDCRPGHYSADKSMDVTSQAVAAELRRMKMRPEVLAA